MAALRQHEAECAMHETQDLATLARCLNRARVSGRIARARQWQLKNTDGTAGHRQVVLALVDVASGESLALTLRQS